MRGPPKSKFHALLCPQNQPWKGYQPLRDCVEFGRQLRPIDASSEFLQIHRGTNKGRCQTSAVQIQMDPRARAIHGKTAKGAPPAFREPDPELRVPTGAVAKKSNRAELDTRLYQLLDLLLP